METRANYVLVGSFVLAVLLGMFVSVLWLAGAQFNRQFAYYDIFFTGSVTGLSVGAPVNYNGVSIGKVTEIRLDPTNPDQVRVTVELDSLAPIKSDSVASLELTGITGVYYVEVGGGTREAPPILKQEGQRYPVIASRPSRLQSFVASIPDVLSRAIEIEDRVTRILSDRNIASITNTLQNVEEISNDFAKGKKIDAVADEAITTLKQIQGVMTSANEALAEVKHATTMAEGAIGDASVTLKTANTTLVHVDGVVQDVRPGVRDFSQRGLSDLMQLIADARVLVASLTRVSEQIERDPTRFFFGERREGYKPR
ncbi:MAG TPA: MlaD family protein [Stellaceae bacterium]|nr:MlaD family protein [Stellaceae bacterium]